MEAEATINKLSTKMQPTLVNSAARADGKENRPSFAKLSVYFCTDRDKKEIAIILITLKTKSLAIINRE